MYLKFAIFVILIWIANCDWLRLPGVVEPRSEFTILKNPFPKFQPSSGLFHLQYPSIPSGHQFPGQQNPGWRLQVDSTGPRFVRTRNLGDTPGVMKIDDPPTILKTGDSQGTGYLPEGQNPGVDLRALKPDELSVAKRSRELPPAQKPEGQISGDLSRSKKKGEEEKKNNEDVEEDLFGDADIDEYEDIVEGILHEKEQQENARKPPVGERERNTVSKEDKPKGNEDELDDIDPRKFVTEEEPNIDRASIYHLAQISEYIRQIERAMEKAFRQTVDEALLLNNTFTKSTEEEENIDGHKYRVHKSIIEAGDNNSSLFIEAIESDAVPERTKRSNWFSEEAHKAKNTDP